MDLSKVLDKKSSLDISLLDKAYQKSGIADLRSHILSIKTKKMYCGLNKGHQFWVHGNFIWRCCCFNLSCFSHVWGEHGVADKTLKSTYFLSLCLLRASLPSASLLCGNLLNLSACQISEYQSADFESLVYASLRWEDNNMEWTGLEIAESQRAVENRKNGKNWSWNHLWCPNDPRG